MSIAKLIKNVKGRLNYGTIAPSSRQYIGGGAGDNVTIIDDNYRRDPMPPRFPKDPFKKPEGIQTLVNTYRPPTNLQRQSQQQQERNMQVSNAAQNLANQQANAFAGLLGGTSTPPSDPPNDPPPPPPPDDPPPKDPPIDGPPIDGPPIDFPPIDYPPIDGPPIFPPYKPPMLPPYDPPMLPPEEPPPSIGGVGGGQEEMFINQNTPMFLDTPRFGIEALNPFRRK